MEVANLVMRIRLALTALVGSHTFERICNFDDRTAKILTI